MPIVRGGFEVPGFRAAGIACNMRYRRRPDLALIVADEPATVAGVFTTNRFTAAPVMLCREHLAEPEARAVLVNAGIANACTGEEGLKRARETADLTATALHAAPDQILVASTGVIGPQIDTEPIASVLPDLVRAARPDGWEQAAHAIMTTDTVMKLAAACVEIDGQRVTIGGIAKGSGMIAPNMATMLAFVCTDAAVSPEVLQYWTRIGADGSFNRITVDGDTSTNDTLLVLASGKAGNPEIVDTDGESSWLFGETLGAVLLDLAQQCVQDAEGATKFIEVHVSGAPDDAAAREIAFTIANSPLVKTAMFGEDANWGRVVAAAGRAGVALDPDRVTLHFDDVCVLRDGTPVGGSDTEARATAVFRKRHIPLHLDLGLAAGEFTVYTSDLSLDYVRINADYRS